MVSGLKSWTRPGLGLMALLQAPGAQGEQVLAFPGPLLPSRIQPAHVGHQMPEKSFILANSVFTCWMIAGCHPVQSQATEASRDGSTVLAKTDGGRKRDGQPTP